MATLQLEIQLATAEFLRQSITSDQRGIPLPNGKERGIRGDREKIFVLKQDPLLQR